MASKNIEKLFKEFEFKGIESLQFWRYAKVGEDWGLTVVGEPFLPSADHKALEEHRWWCHRNYSNDLVGPYTKVNEDWLAGLAAQKEVAYQRTSRDRYQFWGQLAVPVYTSDYKFIGVIELATLSPKRNYDKDFVHIQNLLKYENLRTKALIIKVQYKEHIVKFPLLSFEIIYLWENVTERFTTVNQEAFLIKYVDSRGNRIRISSDDDLQVCIANRRSKEIRMFIE